MSAAIGTRYSLSLQPVDAALIEKRSKPLKKELPEAVSTPVAVKKSVSFDAIVVYDYDGTIAGVQTLRLQKGEKLHVRALHSKGWAEAEKEDGSSGIFPIAFVRRLDDVTPTPTTEASVSIVTATPRVSHSEVVAIQSDDENVSATATTSTTLSLSYFTFVLIVWLSSLFALFGGIAIALFYTGTFMEVLCALYVVTAGIFVIINEVTNVKRPLVRGRVPNTIIYLILSTPMVLNKFTWPASFNFIVLACMHMFAMRPTRMSNDCSIPTKI